MLLERRLPNITTDFFCLFRFVFNRAGHDTEELLEAAELLEKETKNYVEEKKRMVTEFQKRECTVRVQHSFCLAFAFCGCRSAVVNISFLLTLMSSNRVRVIKQLVCYLLCMCC